MFHRTMISLVSKTWSNTHDVRNLDLVDVNEDSAK